jgi:hypothetical protein
MEFAYTAGLSKFGSPEMVIVGLDPDTSGSVLNSIGDSIRSGMRFRDGDEATNILENDTPVRFRTISEDAVSTLLGVAVELFADKVSGKLQALQVIWPDRKGAWPGDVNFSNDLELLL